MIGEQAQREYRSGNPGMFEQPCPDCADLIEPDDQADAWMDSQTGDWYHADCERSHDLRFCQCDACDEDRAEIVANR